MLQMDKKPVLFMKVGWAVNYDGNEPVVGGSSFVEKNPENNSEFEAFKKQDDGYFYCGAGRGHLEEGLEFHAVIVSVDPIDRRWKVAGIYPNAVIYEGGPFSWMKASNALLIAPEHRPSFKWPGLQGLRRWAFAGGLHVKTHQSLFLVYKKLLKHLNTGRLQPVVDWVDPDDEEALEGARKTQLSVHRSREKSLRRAKIHSELLAGKGRLRCQVVGCNFDFYERYGELGRGFIHVHHLSPLGKAPKQGVKVSLRDLAIICPNCHAMVHRHGQSRKLDALISSNSRSRI